MFVQHLKRRTTVQLEKRGIESPVWQRGFYDHIVRRQEALADIQRYILANPVHAGLVDDDEAYPYSFAPGIKAYTGPRNVTADVASLTVRRYLVRRYDAFRVR